jgi:hypothetical protein
MYNADPAGADQSRERRLGPTTAAALHVRWTFPTAGAVTATPVVSGSSVGDQSGHVHALAATDGSWTTPVVAPVTARALIASASSSAISPATSTARPAHRRDRLADAADPHPLAQLYGSATASAATRRSA